MRPEPLRGDGMFAPAAFERDDDAPDDRFYALARKVVHIDDGAIAALGRLYAEVLPAGGALLDLMSSWRSHLPAGAAAGEVVGLGLNAEEMAENPQLTKSVVHDVNREPRLPFGDEAFDGAMCAVSIQYVIHPVRLLRGRRRLDGCARRGPLAGRRRRSAVRCLGARVVRRRHVEAELAEGGAGAGPAVAADEHVGLPRHFSQPVGTRGFLPHPGLLTLLVAPDEGKHDHSEERDDRDHLQRPFELRYEERRAECQPAIAPDHGDPRRERWRASVGGIRPTSASPASGVRRKSFAATTRTSRPCASRMVTGAIDSS